MGVCVIAHTQLLFTMKSTIQNILKVGVLLFLFACSSNKKIDIFDDRVLLHEPDKVMSIEGETYNSLINVTEEVSNSDSIELCLNGQKIINNGKDILPFLMEHFKDSTVTNVYSVYNKRNLTTGEVAMILSNSIQQIPIAQVVGVQQCIPPFEGDIEIFLGHIENRPDRFYKEYENWIKKLK